MSSPPQRRWYAFRLRTLLVVVVVLGCVLTPLAFKMKKARDQKKAVEWVLENHGEVAYNWQADERTSPPGPKWLRGLVGDDLFQTVRSVKLRGYTLILGYDDFRDLTPLQGLTNLQELHLVDTVVHDVTPLTGLTNIRDLSFRSSPVRDLTPLIGLRELQRLDLRQTLVSDLSPLRGLAKLQHLNLRNTTVPDEEVKRLQKALPNCKIFR